MTQKIQIRAKDLSEILQVGPITNMYVVVLGTQQILRIEYDDGEDTAIVPYSPPVRDVTPAKPRASKPAQRKPASKPRKAPEKKKSNPVVDGFKAWWNNKEPPDFMTREFRKW